MATSDTISPAIPHRSPPAAWSGRGRRPDAVRAAAGRDRVPYDHLGPARWHHGRVRCFGDGDPLYERYHDEEWGRPVRDERGLYERLCLEGFQAGLAWITVLRKRPRFREVFADFDPAVVAAYGERDVERLMADPGIIRSRPKIEAAIGNARATLALRGTDTPLEALVWSFAPPPRERRPESLADLPAQTDESRALAAALRGHGFRFLGPTTCYAAMQACGLVDDHIAGCPVVSGG